jgi:hypothetical protein
MCTETSFCLKLLWSDGYSCTRGKSHNQVSFQNLMFCLSPIWNDTLEKKLYLMRISPFQKEESVGLAFTWDRVLDCKYLFVINSCRTSSSLKSLTSHLLRKHLFFYFLDLYPKTPLIFRMAYDIPLSKPILSFMAIILPKEAWSKKKYNHFVPI